MDIDYIEYIDNSCLLVSIFFIFIKNIDKYVILDIFIFLTFRNIIDHISFRPLDSGIENFIVQIIIWGTSIGAWKTNIES